MCTNCEFLLNKFCNFLGALMSKCMAGIIMWRLKHYARVSYFIQHMSLDALSVSEW